MKKRILIAIMTLTAVALLFVVARADVYVVTNPQGLVYSLSDQNDAVIPSGYKLTVMKGQNISNLPITGNPQLYNFNNGAFTINTAAVTAQQNAQTQAIAAQQARDAAKASALEKLTDAITKVDVNDVLTNSEMQALLPSS